MPEKTYYEFENATGDLMLAMFLFGVVCVIMFLLIHVGMASSEYGINSDNVQSKSLNDKFKNKIGFAKIVTVCAIFWNMFIPAFMVYSFVSILTSAFRKKDKTSSERVLAWYVKKYL